MSRQTSEKENTAKRSSSTEDKGPETAEEQKVHQDHLRRLRKYKKKHKQQVVGLVLELLLLVVVIGGYWLVSWSEGIIDNMQIKDTTENPTVQTPAAITTYPGESNLPSTDESGSVIRTTQPTTTKAVEVSWTDTAGAVYTDTMPPEEPYTNPLEQRVVEAQQGYQTIVCFGVDSRDNTTLLRNTQGDVCIIITIDNETKEIRMASVYRDFLFEFATGQFCKLTDAYARYGAEQVVAGLNRNLDLNITEFLVVNWTAVADVVDMLEGIDMEVSEAEATALNDYIYETMLGTGRETTQDTSNEAGVKHFDGVHAVAYSRIRYNVGNDFARTERQRKVIHTIMDGIKDLIRGLKLRRVLDIVELVSLNIKTNMEKSMITSFVTNALSFSIVDSTGFPFTVGHDPAGSYVCSASFVEDVAQLHSFLYRLEDYEPSDNIRRIEPFQQQCIDTGTFPGMQR